MPLDREDLQYFAEDIKATIRDSESRLSARMEKVEEKTESNMIDIAVIKSNQANSDYSSKKWGATFGSAFAFGITIVYQLFFGSQTK
jgi:hypothetical protein